MAKVISIIIPVYNVAAYVGATLDSVLTSTDRLNHEVEIICVDDGATDGSGKILDDYATRENRIRVVHQANAGVSAARNRGMELAQGELIAFLDADDTFLPRALPCIWKAYESTGADVIRYNWKVVTTHSTATDCEADKPLSTSPIQIDGGKLSPLKHARCGQFLVISRQIAKQVRWPALSHGEDPLFALDCFKAASKSVKINAILAEYLVRPGSATSSLTLKGFCSTCAFLKEAAKRCAHFRTTRAMRLDSWWYFNWMLFAALFPALKTYSKDEREQALVAYWEVVDALSKRTDLFDKMERFWMQRAVAHHSLGLLKASVVLPYRLRFKLRKRLCRLMRKEMS